MSGPIAVLVAAAVIVAGGYGLYKISFERGYVQGVEDTRHPEGDDEIRFRGDA